MFFCFNLPLLLQSSKQYYNAFCCYPKHSMKFKQTSKKFLHVELIDTPKPVTGKLCI